VSSDKQWQLRSILPLLTEYTTKLQDIDFNEKRDETYFNEIQPAARKLAQFVSQQLDSVSDDAPRLELELRLAEFEAALRQAGMPKRRRGP
jgi:hypothetical protein